MCGISGTTYKNIDFREAVSCIAYRGPDYFGSFRDDNVSLYHHRLSIIDVDERANQPLADATGKFVIIFNGEIYNYQELRRSLVGEYSFKTESDTEVLVYLYMKHGKDMLRMLNGMYAFSIYDIERGKLFLARDHSGIKPLFYSLLDKELTFSSEVKGVVSILKNAGIAPGLDEESLRYFESFGYIPAPRTLAMEVRCLPKGSWLEFDIVTGTAASGMQPPFEEIDERSLRDIVEEAVTDHLIADVPVGLMFSGGTDSSIIASILNKNGIHLSTWSVSFSGDTIDSKYVDLISKKLDLDSRVYRFGPNEFDSIYEFIMSKIDEPTYDNSLFPTYFIARQAAKEVKVVLSGEGGDEYFFGYERMKVMARMTKRDKGVSLLEKVFFYTPSFKGKNKLFQKLYATLEMPYAYYLITMSPAKDMMSFESWKIAKELLVSVEPPTDIERSVYLESDLLRKTDMATSYASIEGRVPLLDRRLINFAKRANSSQHLQNGGKTLLKKVLAQFLPKDIVYREKSGFGMDLKRYFNESKLLRNEFDEAIRYLENRGLNLTRNFSKSPHDYYINRYPNYCFAIITLARSIRNLGL